tara:strand:+ start:4979 stop:7261 length:2283 start_codon:yes stop_codon:yes gene_type:complete
MLKLPKINSIRDVQKSIRVRITISFMILIIVCGGLLIYIHGSLTSKQEVINQQRLDSTLNIYRSNLAEQLGIIASSDVFIDYIRSGAMTRHEIMPEFLYQLTALKSMSIEGMRLSRKNGDVLFNGGAQTSHQVTLKLCYLNRQLNNQYGACDYRWTLFFNHALLISALQKLNRNIRSDPSYPAMQLTTNDQFGNFDMLPHNPMTLHLKMNDHNGDFLYIYGLIVIAILFIFAVWNNYSVRSRLNHYITDPLERLTGRLQRGESLNTSERNINEVQYLIDQIVNWKQQISQVQAKEKDAEIGKLLSQIVHDIRSPLAAIAVATKDLSGVTEERRSILQCALDTLSDLANNILSLAKRSDAKSIVSDMAEPVAITLTRLVSEKRLQYGEPIAIKLDISDEAYSLFANFDHIEFKRAMSNLMNNAFEAIEQRQPEAGVLHLQLRAHANKRIKIVLSDNGCGIPEKEIEQVLKGKSFGKQSGHGLGLSGAVNLVQSWQGELSVESTVGEGTSITIIIPQTKPAAWFAKDITLYQDSTVIVLDDDKSIHSVWDERFESNISEGDHIKIIHCCSPDELIEYHTKHAIDNVAYLIDYELMNSNMNGLDVIRQLQIADRATLVTSRYENTKVRIDAQDLKVKILPKSFTPFIPVKIAYTAPDVVFLDDNEALTLQWKLVGEQMGKRVAIFNEVDEFERHIVNFNKEVHIYVDVNLGENVHGEVVTKWLYDNGYSNIYLATGYDKDTFPPMPWVKDIVGKEPPFYTSSH